MSSSSKYKRVSEGIEQDPAKLSLPSSEVFGDWALDVQDIVEELQKVAEEFRDICAGLSANQIGYNLKIFVAKIDGEFIPFVNAKIVAHTPERKRCEERCLSRIAHPPVSVKRWKGVCIQHLDIESGEVKTEWFRNRKTAQVIQHEIDHGNGILI